MTFKQTIATSFTTLLLCTGIVANVCGQVTVTVTGHMTAEVIESVHASSTVVTDIALKNEQIIAETLQQNKTSRNTEILNLGCVTINAGLNTACDIKLREASLYDSHGNSFSIETASIASGKSTAPQSFGSQTLSLNGTTNLTRGFASTSYQGSYTVVVLYN